MSHGIYPLSQFMKEGIMQRINCLKCGSSNTKKNGTNKNSQRFYCFDCKKTFTDKPPKVSLETKRLGLMMYLNNVGIRKIAYFLNVSPPAVLGWIKKAHKQLDSKLKSVNVSDEKPDIIELDEIYTFIKKNNKELLYGLLILENKSALLHLK